MSEEAPNAGRPTPVWVWVLASAFLLGGVLLAVDLMTGGPIWFVLHYFFGDKSFG